MCHSRASHAHPHPHNAHQIVIKAAAGPSAQISLTPEMMLHTYDSDRTSCQGCTLAVMAMKMRAFERSKANDRRHEHAHLTQPY
jgi:hypothetical protein